ncbi:uncharacterized protein LOC121417390 [Lytechinus variegatus]|uniref:uncharacterized protein LOC121417390 n=1 Tax=Lytechinus variegatus TaxID=7654 RepID=UPI001BB2595D|nr:uncharacterized protein LOC121417390 [Lytechinus variegatus]
MVFCFNGSNKKVTFQGGEFATVEELVDQAKDKFPDIKDLAVRLQVYDKEVEEFIDAESGEEVKFKSKVKILTAKPETRPQSASTCNASQKPIPCGQTAPTQSTPSSVCAWFTNFKLPSFPDALVDKLESGKTSCANDSAILDVLYESVKPYTVYPTPSQYMVIVDRLLTRYPNLSAHLDVINQKQLWVKKLQYKFQNTRRRDESVRTSLAVLQRKRKHPPTPIQKKESKDVVKYPPVFGMAQYLPSREASEDDESIKLHINWLLCESTKKRPNFEEAASRMALTFADRRRAIVKGDLSIKEIQEQYPWLFKEDGHELLTEFQRIHGSSDALELLKKGLRTFACSLLSSYKTKCLRSKMKGDVDDDLLKIIEEVEKVEDEQVRDCAEGSAALTTIPTLLGEKNNIFKYEIDGDNPGLAIFLKTDALSPMHATEFSLIVDGVMVCRVLGT